MLSSHDPIPAFREVPVLRPEMAARHKVSLPPCADESLIGARAGQATLLKKVASGGTADLYLGADDDGAPVAVKVLRRNKLKRPRYLVQVVNEGTVGRRIRHPHVVKILSAGVLHGGEPYLVMEWLEGKALQSLPPDPLPAPRARSLVAQAAAGLQVVHGLGMIHRDVTLRNLMLLNGEAGAAPSLKLIDFGLALNVGERGTHDDGSVFGTPAYMAPEQWLGEPLDSRCDVYGLACVAFRLFTGRLPYSGKTAREYFLAHRHEAPPTATALCPTVSERTSFVLKRALSKRREARYDSALAFAQALADAGG